MSGRGEAPAEVDGSGPSTPVPELSAGSHFPCLDAYRGIGMTMVLMNHAAYATGFIQRGINPDGSTAERLLGPVIARFDLSVPMFFVLSGFLLYRPFARALLEDRPPLATRVFYRRRALRVLPAYWVALIGIGLIFGLHIASARGWVANAFVLQAFGVPAKVCADNGTCRVGYGITQAWSIGVEVAYYLVLPLFAMAVHRLLRARDRRGRLIGMLAGTALLYAAGTGFRIFVVATDPSWARQSLLWLPMFLDLFAIGMAVSVLSAAGSVGLRIPRAATWLGEHPVLCWAGTAAIFAVMLTLRPPNEPFGLNGTEYVPRQLAYGVASVLWLWPAIFGDQTKGRLRRVLASRPLVYLGGISLSFYLWHLDIIEAVKGWTIPNYDQLRELAANPPPGNTLAGLATFTGNYPLIVVVSWLVSFAVASVLFRLVELPFLRLKDGRLRTLWRRPPAGDPLDSGTS